MIISSLSLRALCDACHEIELAEERNELPEQRWLDQLIDPGTSLGGARPKANVVDTDDHFRNHGFLLTPKGWTLSPAYDINPGAKTHQCLLIDSYTEESDINILLSASESYMLERQDAIEIIAEVRTAIKNWRKVATELQIPLKQLGAYSIRWDEL